MLEDVQFNSLRIGAELRRGNASIAMALLTATVFPGLLLWAAMRR